MRKRKGKRLKFFNFTPTKKEELTAGSDEKHRVTSPGFEPGFSEPLSHGLTTELHTKVRQDSVCEFSPFINDTRSDRSFLHMQRPTKTHWISICSTEMDRVEKPFYTDDNWGKTDTPAIWNAFVRHSSKIDFYTVGPDKVWGADDDTDIEYMYQHLLDVNNASILTGEQIRAGWLKHIYSNEDAPLSATEFQRENSLWVSNETAYYLMKDKKILPPETSLPANNPNFDMIDAQLTTEIFGLFAPSRPDIALKMAYLPIRTTAYGEAEKIAQFYVYMHALASSADKNMPIKEQLFWMAEQAKEILPKDSYPADMYRFIKAAYRTNPDKTDWEKTRDEVYERYQINGQAGYTYKQGFDAGINFAASLVSLFYGEGDLKKTIRIGSLAGWDSDNPTATWAGLIGFMIGKDGVEKAFKGKPLSEKYWIHRTRRNFPDHTKDKIGEDTFSAMAERGIMIIDRVIQEEIKGGISLKTDNWYIPKQRH